jgi:hypothetical protein
VNAILLDEFDVLRPGVDQRDILAVARQMPTDISSDSPRSHDDDALSHASPFFLIDFVDKILLFLRLQ